MPHISHSPPQHTSPHTVVPRLRVRHRPGDHHGFDTVHNYIDWMDISAGRGSGPDISAMAAHFPEDLLHHFNWTEWNQTTTTNRTLPSTDATFEEKVDWLLGSHRLVAFSRGSSYAEEDVSGWTGGSLPGC